MDSLVAGLDLTGLGPPDEEGRFDTEPDRMYDSRDMMGGAGAQETPSTREVGLRSGTVLANGRKS